MSSDVKSKDLETVIATELVNIANIFDAFDLSNPNNTYNNEGLFEATRQARESILGSNLCTKIEGTIEDGAAALANSITDKTASNALPSRISGVNAMFRTLGIVMDSCLASHIFQDIIRNYNLKQTTSIDKLCCSTASNANSLIMNDYVSGIRDGIRSHKAPYNLINVKCSYIRNGKLSSDIECEQHLIDGEHFRYVMPNIQYNPNFISVVIEDSEKSDRYISMLKRKLAANHRYFKLISSKYISRKSDLENINMASSLSINVFPLEPVRGESVNQDVGDTPIECYLSASNYLLKEGMHDDNINNIPEDDRVRVTMLMLYKQLDIALIDSINGETVIIPETGGYSLNTAKILSAVSRTSQGYVRSTDLNTLIGMKSDSLAILYDALKVYQTIGAFNICKML